MRRALTAAALAILATNLSGSSHRVFAQTVADTPTRARAVDGRFISWREHIIDDSATSGIEISGSDGLVVGDLDRDGRPDVVSVHESDTTYDGEAEGLVRIAFGTEEPGRFHNVTLARGREAAAAEDAAIADLDGDGFPDVMVACELAHLVYFQNPGEAARSARWPRLILPVTRGRGSFLRVFLADLDGDGRPEAIAVNKGAQNPSPSTRDRHPVSIFSLHGDPLDEGGWREHELGRYRIPQNSQPVDLDGDGDLDVVVGSRGEGRILWFENRSQEGALRFVEHPIELDRGRAGGFHLAFADFDRDSRLDIVSATTEGLAWLQQPASPEATWKHHRIGSFRPDSMTGFVLADIDGDGDLDAIAGSYSRGPRDRDGEVTIDDPLGRLGWFQQPPDPTKPWSRHDISRRKRGMFDQFEALDVDRDGDLDFLGTRGNSAPYDGVFWLEQVRSERPMAVFQRARENDSEEMPLPDAERADVRVESSPAQSERDS